MARNGGGVYTVGKYRLQRLGDGWAAVWHESGRRRRYRLSAETQEEARQLLDRYARAQELVDAQSSNTVGAIFAAYVKDRRAEGKRSVPILEYNWKALAPRFGHLAPEMVSKALCREYANDRRRRGIKDGTILTELRRLGTALRWAKGEKLIAETPTIWLPTEPKPRDRWLTEAETRALIDAAVAPHIRLFIILALGTAGRSEAILQLTWDRIDFEGGKIFLDNPDMDRTAKGRATVPMNDMARAALATAKAEAITSHVIEWKQDRVRSIKKGFAASVKAAGIEHCTPHDIRRTAASWMVMQRVPIEEVARYLGHTNPRITWRTYGRFAPDLLKDASQAVNLDLRRAV